ncbi:MAG: arsenite methyltransferase [Bryobacterales bacterium]|nr:arsenite methyltransferase [Bryobacteraceae bacterium]MDW8353034.1 arsenite methyltransferase [Bryobacterales bacterium]
MRTEELKEAVKQRYGAIAREGGGCCVPAACCQGPAQTSCSETELRWAPTGTLLGLGCGNPLGVANVGPGETVLDLGSGAGLDCLLAAQRVGPRGRVIGVDMTPEMVERARENARRAGLANVEFRFGEIEDLPLEDNSVDVLISNCVINLSPDKRRVFQQAYRVLKPGGRLVVADIVLTGALPEPLRDSLEAYTGCVAGAMGRDDYLALIEAAGFESVEVTCETPYWGPARSITVRAHKPWPSGESVTTEDSPAGRETGPARS